MQNVNQTENILEILNYCFFIIWERVGTYSINVVVKSKNVTNCVPSVVYTELGR